MGQAVDQLSDVARKLAETPYLPLETMEQRAEQQKALGDLHFAANAVSDALQSLMSHLVAGSIQVHMFYFAGLLVYLLTLLGSLIYCLHTTQEVRMLFWIVCCLERSFSRQAFCDDPKHVQKMGGLFYLELRFP